MTRAKAARRTGGVARVTHQARDHDLVHGVDHAGRGAGARQRVADLDHVGDGGALAAQVGRHQNAEQALRPGGRECLLGKSGIAIDRARMGRGHARNRLGAALEAGRRGDDGEWRRRDGVHGLAGRPRCAVGTAEIFSQRHVDDSSQNGWRDVFALLCFLRAELQEFLRVACTFLLRWLASRRSPVSSAQLSTAVLTAS
jgi:hypothetical protein